MSNNGKIKFYRNKARIQPETFKPYVPQYQTHGIEPGEYNSPIPPGVTIAVQKTPPLNQSQDGLRGMKPAIRQPYAEAVDSPIGRGKGLLPNVGNNVEQTWSSVDGDIVDDISGVELDDSMIDNNEFVTENALRQQSTNQVPFITKSVMEKAIDLDDTLSAIKDLEEEEYLLMVNGVSICSGPMDFIQEQTTALVFGEHVDFPDDQISVDNILIIKRVAIKVGVFLA